jgi:hypothetical protein
MSGVAEKLRNPFLGSGSIESENKAAAGRSRSFFDVFRSRRQRSVYDGGPKSIDKTVGNEASPGISIASIQGGS